MDHLLENPVSIVIITLVGVGVVLQVLVLVAAGGDGRRMRIAFRSFRRALRDQDFVDKVEPLLTPPQPKDLTPPRPSGAPLRLLALLQREGRLLDFLLEAKGHHEITHRERTRLERQWLAHKIRVGRS